MTIPSLPITSRTSSDNLTFDDVYANDSAIVDWLDGGIENDNLSGSAGITAANLADDAKPIRSRGKAIISAEQSTTSSSFTLLGTPDRVQNIVLPTDGLIFVVYRALVRGGVGEAGLHLNDVVIRSPVVNGPPISQTAVISDTDPQWLFSSPGRGLNPPSAGAAASDDGTTTGLVVGYGSDITGTTVATIEAAAGTYEVAVKYKAASGTIYAKNRKLWVWSQAF